MGAMKRHMHWLILLIAAPLAYVLLMLGVQAMSRAASGADGGTAVGLGWAQLALLLAAVVVPIVLVIRAIVQMVRTYRRAQRAKGRFTPSPLQLPPLPALGKR